MITNDHEYNQQMPTISKALLGVPIRFVTTTSKKPALVKPQKLQNDQPLILVACQFHAPLRIA